MKILRLSYFNIKKHKAETISLFVLVLLCMTLLASAVTGISGIDHIMDNAFEKTGCVHNRVLIDERNYKPIYQEFFDKDERIDRYVLIELARSDSTKYIDDTGKENSLSMGFITEENDARMEKLILESGLSRDEIFSKEHFILLPFYAKDTLGYREGDTFQVLYNEKVYPFEVAGFYESGFFADAGMGLKCIVNSKDYNMLAKLFGKCRFIGFETKDQDDAKAFLEDFNAYAEKNALGSEAMGIVTFTYEEEKEQSTQVTKMLMGLMIAMSVVVFIAVAFMIRFRIKSDIEEQMVSIGVLEALGHKSGEIAFSYVLEYLLIALPGIICGLILSIFTAPVLLRVGEIMAGHHGAVREFGMAPVFLGLMIMLFVALISFFRALRIRKFPPVMAFRKGTENHSHKKNRMPLEKTRSSVHLRLAAKSFLADMKTNIGMGVCISVAVIALMVCFVINDFLGGGVNALAPLTGLDISDISIEVTAGTDTDLLKQEIEAMPEVRKATLTNSMMDNTAKIDGIYMGVLSYQDFEHVENIKPSAGRCPKHDNEIMMQAALARLLKKEMGDIVTLQIGKIEADYVICGFTNNIFIVTVTGYLTDAGYKRLRPSYFPSQIDIYLKDGAAPEAFKKKLYNSFGAPASENGSEGVIAGNLEERIRAEADAKIGTLLEMYGVNYLDYAIQIGDQMIMGDSSRFQIKSSFSVTEMLEQMLANIVKAFSVGTGIFMVISVFTITMIVFLIIHSAVRKQRNELGVLKGMGYTSRELMLQTAAKVVPTLVVSVIVGCVVGILLGKLIYSQFGNLPVVTVKVILIGGAVILFGFAVAYFSARKIKDISVYELMQE